MRDFAQIREMTVNLQRRRTALVNHMLEVQRFYQADWVTPLPDVRGEPDMAHLTPSHVTDVVDSLAMRASGVTPVTFCPALKPHIPGSVAKATTRRKSLNATYHLSNWKIKRRRYYRHMTAYDTASIYVQPDFKERTMKLMVRNPLETYPEFKSAEDVTPPSYVAFITRYSGDNLRYRFPQVREEAGGPIAAQHGDEQWDIFEWVDDDQMVFGLLGPTTLEGDHVNAGYTTAVGHGPWMQLGPSVKNLAGRCLAVTPAEISLHNIGNRLNSLLGSVKMQAQLMAMEVNAQQKAVYPDAYAVANPNETPQIVGGEWKDGRTGEINLLSGVNAVGTVNSSPPQQTAQMIDRLERNFKVSAGMSPQMQGESYGSLRTGRALDSMMASSVDPRIQELHEVTEAWMPAVNKAILAGYKGWFPDDKFVYFSGWTGDKGVVEFTPAKDFDSLENTVSYNIPGADVVQVTQVLGSMLGAKVISTDTFQGVHPWIEDGEAEQTQIEREDIQKAMLAGVQEQIASGQMPIAVSARLYDLVNQGEPLHKALTIIDEEIRAEQAAAQQQAQEDAAAAQAAAAQNPAAQMGLAAGPAAAAPGAPPMGPGGPEEALAAQGPEAAMQAMMSGALGAA